MNLYTSLEAIPSNLAYAVAIGNFDGIHIGHVALIEHLKKWGQAHQTPTLILTFEPHPVEVLKPGTVIGRLTTPDEKSKGFEDLGIENELIHPFTLELSKYSAEQFLERFLVKGLRAKAVFIGQDFAFGQGRSGDIPYLEKWAASRKIEVFVEKLVERNGKKIGSSAIRDLLAEGNVKEVAVCLGHPYQVTGTVIRGDGRGRQLGIPTANLAYPRNKMIPKVGVFTTQTSIEGKIYGSVTNIGYRPTFGQQGEPLIETHLLNLPSLRGTSEASDAATPSLNLYGKSISVQFLDRIRDEMKFASKEALIAQIQKDIEKANET